MHVFVSTVQNGRKLEEYLCRYIQPTQTMNSIWLILWLTAEYQMEGVIKNTLEYNNKQKDW